MACAQIPDLPVERFARDVIQKWIENRVPVTGCMELDLRCNLRCQHCYRDGDWPPDIMKADEVKGILDRMAEAGTLWLLLTGGEVFLRRDFFEIYEHARRLGLLITIFTNGTMVTEDVADRLSQLPPYNIEITLYGRTPETYERVTGVPGSWAKCYRGVELLLERRLPLRLKTVVIKTNQHELLDLAHYARDRGVPFKYDTMINPNFNGSLTPCNVRLSPRDAVELDFALPGREKEFRDYFEPRRDLKSDRVFTCGAGSQTFHIDPYGMMKMCLLLRQPEFSLREHTFLEIWNDLFPPITSMRRDPGHGCNRCTLVSLCNKCPAWSQMEKGDLAARVDYTCEVGHRRAARLGHEVGPFDLYDGTVIGRPDEILLPVSQPI